MNQHSKQNRRYFRLVLRLMPALLLAFVLSGCDGYRTVQAAKDFLGIDYGEAGRNTQVELFLAVDEGVTVLSENPVLAEPGSTVCFTISADEETVIDSVSEGTLSEDGVLTLTDVRYASTIIVRSHPRGSYAVTAAVSGDAYGDGGTVNVSAAHAKEGSSVTLTAAADDQYVFTAFSLDQPLSEGGEFISTETPCLFYPEADAVIYANFSRSAVPVTLKLDDRCTPDTFSTVADIRRPVSFAVTLESGYTFDSLPEGFTYKNGVLTLSGVEEPLTAELATRKLTSVKCTVKLSDKKAGSVKMKPDKKKYTEGDSITLTVTAKKGYKFVGFSADALLENGGTALSYASVYTCTLNADTVIYANFVGGTSTVELLTSDGLDISGSRKKTVDYGDSVSFSVKPEDGYVIDAVSSGAVYKDGKLTLKTVERDTVLRLSLRRKNEVRVLAESAAPAWGAVENDCGKLSVEKGTAVTLSAQPAEGCRFTGYSHDGPAAAGNAIFSTAAQLTLTAEEDTVVYANFVCDADLTAGHTAPEKKWLLLYHPNGGTNTKTHSGAVYESEFKNTFYLCPNALIDKGTFVRDGYVLLGYNTAADGSGRWYYPGWNVIMPEDGVIMLYCMWAKVTDPLCFDYTVSNKKATITAYHGDNGTVVIPEQLDGCTVTGIASSAFDDCEAMKALVLSRTVKTLSSRTVMNCPALTSVLLYDSITTMPDDWVYGSEQLSSLCIRACRSPTYCKTHNGTYAIKFERLETAPGTKLVMVSGSNLSYGVNSPLLTELLSAEGLMYSVVNLAQNHRTPICFYLEVTSHFIHENDVVLVAPELSPCQYGCNDFTPTLWQLMEAAYEAVSYVDIRNYSLVYSFFAEYNRVRAQMDPVSYTDHDTSKVNRYGDYSAQKTGATPEWSAAMRSLKSKNSKKEIFITTALDCLYNETYASNLRAGFNAVTASGGRVLFSFPSLLKIALSPASQIEGCPDQKAWVETVASVLPCEIISKPSDYLMDSKYFYNSDYHLNTKGADVRTRKLAEDLIRCLKQN